MQAQRKPIWFCGSVDVEEHMASRLASVSSRGEDGKFVDFPLAPPSNPEFYGMGHALYSTAPDYMRFLRMYLNKGVLDGTRILSEEGLRSMLSNRSLSRSYILGKAL